MLFEESSSDEDEKKPVAANTNTTEDDGKTAEDGKRDSGDDDDDDDKDKPKPSGDSNSEEKKKESTAGLFDDSSDDDDDAVFDDAGAVVGSSAPVSTKKIASNDPDGDGPDGSKKRSVARTRRTQHATVLKADRPEAGTSLHMAKLPNVVAIQPTAFDENDYDENEEEEQYMGYMHNMVRWRYKKDATGALLRDGAEGSLVRESNSKLVKWSDGSFTLHIGKEAFGIQNVDSSTSGGFSGLNGYVYQSQKATFQNDKDGDDDEELQNGGTVLECIGPVASRLVTKPSSLQSESHKSLTVAVRQRTVKRAKIGQYMTEEDPERLKQERIKYNADADKLKQRKRTSTGGGGGYQNRSGGRRPGMNRGYLEASDDEGYDTVNLRALKKGSASNNNYDMDEMDDYGDESDDEYDQSFANRNSNRKRQRKAAVEDDSDDDEEMVFDDDDDEEVKIHQKKKSAAVLDDDE